VMDARFQDDLVSSAQRAGKLPRDYRVPEAARANSPQQLARRLRPWQAQNLLQELPFGSDFTTVETTLAKALRYLAASLPTWTGRVELLRALALRGSDRSRWQPHLQRMELLQASSLQERLQRRLVLAALQMVSQDI